MGVVAALALTVAFTADGLLQPGRSGPFPGNAGIAADDHLLVRAQAIMTPQDTRSLAPEVVPPNTDKPNADKLNNSIVTVITDPVGGAWAAMGSDMASVLDDGENLRVLPIIGKGSVQNILDILRLRSVDTGFVLTDALQFVKTEYRMPNLEQRVSYIMKVFNAEVHIIARKEITSIRDLEGKKIFAERNVGYFSARNILRRFHVKADIDFKTDEAMGLHKLLSGEADAWIVSVGKIAPMIRSIRNEGGRFHLLPIPYDKVVQDIYLPSTLTSADYPNLIAPGSSVDTLAVSAVLLVYNWPVGTERYNRAAKLVDVLFRRIGELQQQPRHPKWRESVIAASVPGLQRFKAADDWLKSAGKMSDLSANALVTRKLLDAPGPGERDLYGELLQGRRRNIK
jgi:TRAP-type uncharacterized transport system substrate-binding protein